MAGTAARAASVGRMATEAMVAQGAVRPARMQLPLVASVVPAVPLERYPEMGVAVEPGARRPLLREAVTTPPAERVVPVEPRQPAPVALEATGALHRQTISLSAVLVELVVRRLAATAVQVGTGELARRMVLVCLPAQAAQAARRSTEPAAQVVPVETRP